MFLVVTALLVLFYYLRIVMTGLMMNNVTLKLSTISLSSTLFMMNFLLIRFMAVTLFNIMS